MRAILYFSPKNKLFKIIEIILALLLITCLDLFNKQAMATTYYSGDNLNNVTDLSRWWTNDNDTGLHPIHFNNPEDTFVIQYKKSAPITVNDPWSPIGTVEIRRALFFNTSLTFNGDVILNEGSLYLRDPSSYVTIDGDLIVSGNAASSFAGSSHLKRLSINGDIIVNENATMRINMILLEANNNTIINGKLLFFNSTGEKDFKGDLIINSSGSWKNTTQDVMIGGNLIINGGDFTSGTGEYRFYGIEKRIFVQEQKVFFEQDLLIDGTITIEGEIEVNKLLKGAGTLINGPGSYLRINDRILLSSTDFSSEGNTLEILGRTNKLNDTIYHNVILNLNDKRFALLVARNNDITIANDLIVASGRLFIDSEKKLEVLGKTTLESDGEISFRSLEATINSDTLSLNGGIIGSSVFYGKVSANSLYSAPATSTEIQLSSLSVRDSSLIYGKLNIPSKTTSTNFEGSVSVQPGGGLETSPDVTIHFGDNLELNGDNSGLSKTNLVFTGSEKSIRSNASYVSIGSLSIEESLTNDIDSLVIQEDLSGNGTLVNPQNKFLKINNHSSLKSVIANAEHNTIEYNGNGSQLVASGTYYNLIINQGETSDTLYNDNQISVINRLAILSGKLAIDDRHTGEDLIASGLTTISEHGTLTFSSANAEIALDSLIANNGEIGDTVAGDLTVNKLIIPDSYDLNIKNVYLTVNEAVLVEGNIIFNTVTGAAHFMDDISIAPTGQWSCLENTPIEFGGSFSLDAPFFDPGNGTYHFTGINKSINSTKETLDFENVFIDGEYINNVRLLGFHSDLKGFGKLTNASGCTINIAGDATIAALDASSNIPNTIEYNGAQYDQQGKSTDYYNLTINKGANQTVTFDGNVYVENKAKIKNGGMEMSNADAHFTGNALSMKTGTFLLLETENIALPEITGEYALETNSTIGFVGDGPQYIHGQLGPGKTAYQNISFSSSTPARKEIISDLTARGNFTISDSSSIISEFPKTISLGGNWINESTNPNAFIASRFDLIFNGSSLQRVINTSGEELFSQVTINNTTSDSALVLETPVTIYESLDLQKGIIHTSDSNLLEIQSGATCSSGSNDSFVDGPMLKRGPDAFVFPVGNNNKWARIGISAPQSKGAIFKAQYFATPHTNTTTLETDLLDVSTAEYWELEKGTDSDSVYVSLFWEDAAKSNLDYCDRLTIGHWDENKSVWEELKAIKTENWSCNDGGKGSIKTEKPVKSFSPFTIARKNTGGPLPVELIDFTAKVVKDHVVLNWSTASEKDNDYFTIERGKATDHFDVITTVKGAGDSNKRIDYEEIDYYPLHGVSYYRLKQTDFDGQFKYEKTISMQVLRDIGLIIYPNPSEDSKITLRPESNNAITGSIFVYDINGSRIFEIDPTTNKTTNGDIVIDFADRLKAGTYYLKVSGDQNQHMYRFVIHP